MAALAAIELLLAARGVHDATPAGDLAVTTPLLERLRADRDVFRILPLHTFLPPNTATPLGLDDVRGYDALAPAGWRRQRAALGLFAATPTVSDAIAPWDLRPGGAGLDFWNVKYLCLHPQFPFGAPTLNERLGLDLEEVYSGPDGRLLRNRRVLPRARVEGAEGTVTVLERLPTRWSLDVSAAAPARARRRESVVPRLEGVRGRRATRVSRQARAIRSSCRFLPARTGSSSTTGPAPSGPASPSRRSPRWLSRSSPGS